MLKNSSILAALVLTIPLSSASGQKYSLELIEGPPPADEGSEELVKQFATEGVRVKRGARRTACEIWFCKQWPVAADFSPTDEVLYPFTPGQLIGVIEYKQYAILTRH